MVSTSRLCMASRASLMTGYRPDHANIYNCDSVKSLIPDARTLNKHFEANGYEIWATGKIYHHGEDHEAQPDARVDGSAVADLGARYRCP